MSGCSSDGSIFRVRIASANDRGTMWRVDSSRALVSCCGALEQLQRKPHCAGIVAGTRGWLRAGHGREQYRDPMNHDTVTVRCDRMAIL